MLAENWLEEAFAYASRPVRGARGILTRRRPRRGEPTTVDPVFRLADYLEQHGRQTRRTQRIPSSMWESALHHNKSGRALARFAGACGLLRVAFHLERKAAASGIDEAARRAGNVLRKAGRENDALQWYQKAGGAGDPEAALWAGQLLWQQGRVWDALDWFDQAARTGLAESAAAKAWSMLHSVGSRARAKDWMGEGGPVLKEQPDESLAGWKRPQRLRLTEEVESLLAQGRTEAALNLLQVTGEEWPSVFRRGAVILKEHGLIDEAVRWFEMAFGAGDIGAAWRAGRTLREQGRDDEAMEWYQRGAYAGDRTALQRVAYLMRDRGRLDEAVEWAQRAADTGDKSAFGLAVDLLDLQGKHSEAAQLAAYGWDLDGTISEPWDADDEL
jgi:TPR repeat protein